MGREAKLGLGVLALLLTVFGGLLALRLGVADGKPLVTLVRDATQVSPPSLTPSVLPPASPATAVAKDAPPALLPPDDGRASANPLHADPPAEDSIVGPQFTGAPRANSSARHADPAIALASDPPPAFSPPPAASPAPGPAATPPASMPAGNQGRGNRVYVVAQGDTLVEIARFELGNKARWGEIYELNRDKLGQDFNYLVPGTELVMPAPDPATRGTLTERPAPVYRR